MHITDHVMSHKFADPLDTLSNDSRAQMSDMQWLGNIGPAVIYNNGLRMCRFVTAKSSLICFHIADIFRQIGRTYFHIDKSRFYRLYALKQFVFCQRLRNLIRNHEWCTLVLLCCSHCSVTLIFTQVRTIGKCNFPVFCIISLTGKCICHLLGDQIY